MGERIVLTGGCGSGKSAYALDLARRAAGCTERVFIATATPFDDEMTRKIERHREERGDDFKTVEEPMRLAETLAEFAGSPHCCAVVDCLTVWMCNIAREKESEKMKDDFARVFESFSGVVIAVTNETGMGIVPPEKQTREYAANLSELNRRIVSLSDRACLLVSGQPLQIKPPA